MVTIHETVSEKEEAILKFVARYRIGTIDSLYKVLYQGESRDASHMAAYLLVKKGFLKSYEVNNKTFYQLTKKGAAVIGEPESAATPLGPQAHMHRSLTLAFCAKRGVNKLTPKEVRNLPFIQGDELSPELQDYYLWRDDEGRPKLVRIVHDMGSEGERLVKKVKDIVRAMYAGRGLSKLIERGLFALTVLTTREDKGETLSSRFSEEQLGVPVYVEVVRVV